MTAAAANWQPKLSKEHMSSAQCATLRPKGRMMRTQLLARCALQAMTHSSCRHPNRQLHSLLRTSPRLSRGVIDGISTKPCRIARIPSRHNLSCGSPKLSGSELAAGSVTSWLEAEARFRLSAVSIPRGRSPSCEHDRATKETLERPFDSHSVPCSTSKNPQGTECQTSLGVALVSHDPTGRDSDRFELLCQCRHSSS